MPPEAIERMEKALQGMAVLKSGISGRQQGNLPSGYQSGDDEDPAYLQDRLNDLTRGPRAQKDLENRIEEQKQIDDARIAIVYEALSKGLELKGNPLYEDMLDQYPYFQKRLQERKQAISRLAKLAQVQNENSRDQPGDFEGGNLKKNTLVPKYKFEQKFVDKQIRKSKQSST